MREDLQCCTLRLENFRLSLPAGLMAANLAGFVVGRAGLPPLLSELLARPAFVAASLFVFFAAAHLMFALRECEAVTGRRNCPVDAIQKAL